MGLEFLHRCKWCDGLTVQTDGECVRCKSIKRKIYENRDLYRKLMADGAYTPEELFDNNYEGFTSTSVKDAYKKGFFAGVMAERRDNG